MNRQDLLRTSARGNDDKDVNNDNNDNDDNKDDDEWPEQISDSQ